MRVVRGSGVPNYSNAKKGNISMDIYTCTICGKDFKSERSLRSHLNWHKPGYAERSKAGAAKGRPNAVKVRVAQLKDDQLSAKQKYNASPNKCKNCQSVLPYEQRGNKFCSHSCSASYTNRCRVRITSSKFRKNLTNHKLHNYPKTPKEIRKCVICNRNHIGAGKTCSSVCKNIHLSSTLKNLISSGKYDPRTHRGRHRRSYMEESFEKWLIENGVTDYKPEHHIKRYDENGKFVKNYFIDFYFPKLGLAIELDGTHHLLTIEQDRERDNYLNTIGITVLRITHKEYIAKTRIDEIKLLLGIIDGAS